MEPKKWTVDLDQDPKLRWSMLAQHYAPRYAKPVAELVDRYFPEADLGTKGRTSVPIMWNNFWDYWKGNRKYFQTVEESLLASHLKVGLHKLQEFPNDKSSFGEVLLEELTEIAKVTAEYGYNQDFLNTCMFIHFTVVVGTDFGFVFLAELVDWALLWTIDSCIANECSTSEECSLQGEALFQEDKNLIIFSDWIFASY